MTFPRPRHQPVADWWPNRSKGRFKNYFGLRETIYYVAYSFFVFINKVYTSLAQEDLSPSLSGAALGWRSRRHCHDLSETRVKGRNTKSRRLVPFSCRKIVIIIILRGTPSPHHTHMTIRSCSPTHTLRYIVRAHTTFISVTSENNEKDDNNTQ